MIAIPSTLDSITIACIPQKILILRKFFIHTNFVPTFKQKKLCFILNSSFLGRFQAIIPNGSLGFFCLDFSIEFWLELSWYSGKIY